MEFMNDTQHKLVYEIASILSDKNETLSVAESSSGGLTSAFLLSFPGASDFYIGGGVLYSYQIRKGIVNMGEKEHAQYSGSTPQLIMDIAKKFQSITSSTWVIGEGGAAGPSPSPYGHPAGYTAFAITGPVDYQGTMETGSSDRTTNMSLFSTELLSIFLKTIKVHHNL